MRQMRRMSRSELGARLNEAVENGALPAALLDVFRQPDDAEITDLPLNPIFAALPGAIARDVDGDAMLLNAPVAVSLLRGVVRDTILRPPLLIDFASGTYEEPPCDFATPICWTDILKPSRDILNATHSSVGRLHHSGGSTIFGTGFVTHGGLIVTNAHVALEFLTLNATRGGFDFRVDVDIDFSADPDVLPGPTFRITDVLYVANNGRADIAVLASTRQDELPADLALSPRGAPDRGLDVAAIGYPTAIEGTLPVVDELRFGGAFGVKRLSPGQITDVTNHTRPETLFHDCSTLKGSSGSPVVDIDNGLVVGISSGMGVSFNLGPTVRELSEVLSLI